MTITIAFIALAIGLLIGWMAAKARSAPHLHRTAAERDLALAERRKAEALAAEMQRRVETAQQAQARAETRASEADRVLASHAEMRKQIEEAFAMLAQRA